MPAQRQGGDDAAVVRAKLGNHPTPLWRRRDRMQDPYAGVFVEQMLGELCKGIGIVESRRGATGG